MQQRDRSKLTEPAPDVERTSVHDPELAMLPESIRSLPPEALERLVWFRTAALDAGIPEADVDRWLRLARPSVELVAGGDGPVVARCGGPVMLPPGVPTPADDFESAGNHYRVEHQLIATLDLSAIPAGATDIPLPDDGRLLLFANPDLEPECFGGAVYIPAGTPVEERETNLDWEPVYEYDSPEDLDASLRSLGELRLRHGVTLPEHPITDRDTQVDLKAHPCAENLREVWRQWYCLPEGGHARAFMEFQVGGYAGDFDDYGDPVQYAAHADAEMPVAARTEPEGWVLLAEWHGLPMATLYWAIPRQDLPQRRFDRVQVMMWANP